MLVYYSVLYLLNAEYFKGVRESPWPEKKTEMSSKPRLYQKMSAMAVARDTHGRTSVYRLIFVVVSFVQARVIWGKD